MRSSTMFIAIALSLAGAACASSGVQIDKTSLSHGLAGGALDGLWVASPKAQPEGDVQVAYQSDEKQSDLWMKRGLESNTDGLPGRESPRLDAALSRITPENAPTFVHASYPAKARQ